METNPLIVAYFAEIYSILGWQLRINDGLSSVNFFDVFFLCLICCKIKLRQLTLGSVKYSTKHDKKTLHLGRFSSMLSVTF